VAFSGLLALVVAFTESTWYPDAQHDFISNLIIWTSTAVVALGLSTVDTVRRSRKVYVEFAPTMLHIAMEQFVPALAVGALLTAVIVRLLPNEGWLLPGLWEIIFSLGIFASCRFLPRPMFAVGVWYLAAGLCSIVACSAQRSFMPWTMGLPFGVGQLLVATVLQVCVEENPDQV